MTSGQEFALKVAFVGRSSGKKNINFAFTAGGVSCALQFCRLKM